MPTECSPYFFRFERVEGRAVVAAFDAGAIPSTAIPMILSADVIEVSRSNLAERLQVRPKKRVGRPPQPDGEFVAKIRRSLLSCRPTAIDRFMPASSARRWSRA
jgi:hypothetical protein